VTPRVSVVIPAWNAAPFIRSSIDSVLAQSVSDLELIVVDDGSTDDTSRAVGSVPDDRVRLIRQENGGQSAALNAGASAARGEFIKFLDADDWLNPRHIEAQLAALDATTDMLASCRWGYFVHDPARPQVRTEHTHRDYDDPMQWLVDSLSLDEGMMGGWMWLIPRSVWERSGGWDESLSLNNDFDFSIRLLLASKGIRFSPDAVYSYREGVSGALSATRSRAAMDSAFRTTESGCRSLLAREDSPRVRRVCADRWQRWVYQFYPEHADLAARAEREVAKLGGSDLRLEGGRVLDALLPVIGWKAVRRLQARAYESGWRRVLGWKAQRRLDAIARGGSA
jgi:glycosyltransferase involved in cell wall biosynthesis